MSVMSTLQSTGVCFCATFWDSCLLPSEESHTIRDVIRAVIQWLCTCTLRSIRYHAMHLQHSQRRAYRYKIFMCLLPLRAGVCDAGGMWTASLMQRQAKATTAGRCMECRSRKSTVMRGMRPARMITSAMILRIKIGAGSLTQPCMARASALRQVETARLMEHCSVRYKLLCLCV